MKANTALVYIKEVLKNMPSDWVTLTTHRLDIYNEDLAKTEFLQEFENLYHENISDAAALRQLPTAYDYIRLGHPLSCILEWGIAQKNGINAKNVISFSSQTMPIYAILRMNALEHKNTRILYQNELPEAFNASDLKTIYGYSFDLVKVGDAAEVEDFNGSTIYLSHQNEIGNLHLYKNIDFHLHLYGDLGSVLVVNTEKNAGYISAIQHVRRRETIAMTPTNTLAALQAFVEASQFNNNSETTTHKSQVLESIKAITNSPTTAVVASSGLSMQYAIMMGLVHEALEQHKGKDIKFIVPPNCYGGTNDQARRVADSLEHVTVVDLPVDGDNDMVQSIETILAEIAHQDAIPYIIAEIPTNPRVEVPNLEDLRAVLSKKRSTATGSAAVDPVFILDQTFCPNVHFLGEGAILSSVRALSYASGSKFPSGGKCTAGYCVGNTLTQGLMTKIERHLILCDNEATPLQYELLAEQLPSMKKRIKEAYINTRDFVDFIKKTLPEAKLNFVSDDLAEQGFTPSVFSLGLPTKGATDDEQEAYKRALNLKLINLMITEIPDESKFCVSYGQLKGSYWTVPATSTQGTTKEGDKDYIVRVSLSPNLDMERHKKVFREFVASI
ncbi:cystathionine beta-synthase [Gelidibacter salicanalis]|uniref:Cystathionine beta-synthase n=1 Tax=Gelidibacter salicanalis TaxID=291193 RepID=A0A5C7AH98_9FLAO|nr:cystathionine beta-synthase [Gelidibacter salicanalis]TXE07781.1 cystathionine beta-synthase [Gelidibacter salicanalis]